MPPRYTLPLNTLGDAEMAILRRHVDNLTHHREIAQLEASTISDIIGLALEARGLHISTHTVDIDTGAINENANDERPKNENDQGPPTARPA